MQPALDVNSPESQPVGAVVASGVLQCAGTLEGDVRVAGGLLRLAAQDQLTVSGDLTVQASGTVEVTATDAVLAGGHVPLSVEGGLSFQGALDLRLDGTVCRALREGDTFELLAVTGLVQVEESATVVARSLDRRIASQGFAFVLEPSAHGLRAVVTRAEVLEPGLRTLLGGLFQSQRPGAESSSRA